MPSTTSSPDDKGDRPASSRPTNPRTFSTPLDDLFWNAAQHRHSEWDRSGRPSGRERATTLVSSNVAQGGGASKGEAGEEAEIENDTCLLTSTSREDEWASFRQEAAQRQRQGRHRRRVKSLVENGPRGKWHAYGQGHDYRGAHHQESKEGEARDEREDSDQDEEEEDDDDDEEEGKQVIGVDGEEGKTDEQRQHSEGSAKPQVGSTVPVDPQLEAAEEAMSDEKRLMAIQEEFGGVEARWGINEGKEMLLADAPCVLHRRAVLVKGVSLLTTHRLCFLAKLAPPDPAAILKDGACFFKKAGRFQSKRRIWLELKHDMLTAYPSSQERYNPIGCLLLSEVQRLLPQRWDRGSVLKLRIQDQGVVSLDLGTADAAALWRKELEAAIFAIHLRSDRIRIAVPLPRILGASKVGSMKYTRAIHIDVEEGMHLTLGLSEVYASFTEQLAKTLQDKPERWRGWKGEKPEIVFEVERAGSSRLAQDEAHHTDDDYDEDPHDGAAPKSPTDSGEALARKLIRVFGLQCAPDALRIVSADIAYRRPGALALSPSHLLFFRRGWTHETHLKLPLADLEGVERSRSHFRVRHFGLRIKVRGHADLHFEVGRESARDAMWRALTEVVEERRKKGRDRQIGSWGEKPREPPASASDAVQVEEKDVPSSVDPVPVPTSTQLPSTTSQINPSHKPLDPTSALLAEAAAQRVVVMENSTFDLLPKVVNEFTTPYRLAPMRIVCLTIGSRGDVQPYIALAKGLMKHGHEVIIASHPEYRPWVESHGILFRGLGGDPATLMKVAEEHRLFSPQFFMDSIDRLRNWLDELLREAREATWDAELIIESPSTFAGIHCAEANGCFYMRAFSLLWTKTSAYPHAFAPQPSDVVPDAIHNLSSYALFDSLFWRSSSSQINRWRKHMLGLEPTSLASLHQDQVPFLYCFSPHVIPPPLDWPTNCYACGYWVLEGEAESQAPSKDLVEFLEKAKRDQVPVAYIGFGSIVFEKSLADVVYQGVIEAGVRAVFAKGWSDRLRRDKGEQEPEPPKDVFVLDAVPHDWLFPRIDLAAVHHGGAGTTAATLRHGLPTLIHPSFGDQHLWARRVEALGVGVRLPSMTAKALSTALSQAKSNRIMKEKCQDLSVKLKNEKGVQNAISFIYSHLSASKRVPRPLLVEPIRGASESEAQHQPPTSEHSKSLHKSKTWSLGTSSLRRVASPLGIFARRSSDGDKVVQEEESSASDGENGDEEDEGAEEGVWHSSAEPSTAASTPRTSQDEEAMSGTRDVEQESETDPNEGHALLHGKVATLPPQPNENEEGGEGALEGPKRSSTDAATPQHGNANSAGRKLAHGMALLHHMALPSLMRAKAQEDDSERARSSPSSSSEAARSGEGAKLQDGEGVAQKTTDTGEKESGQGGEEEKSHLERVMAEKRSYKKAKEEDRRRRERLEVVMRREREKREEEEKEKTEGEGKEDEAEGAMGGLKIVEP